MTAWIINVPVDLREFITANSVTKHYLAVKKHKKYISVGDIAILWGGRHTDSPGILGYGMIITDPMKPTDIPKSERNFYDVGSWQVGFRPVHLSYESAIIPEQFAYKLPSLNETKQPTRINRKSIYSAWWLFDELSLFIEDYYHLFEDFFFEKYDANSFYFVIHLLREKYFIRHNFKKYHLIKKKGALICSVCQTDLESKLGIKSALRVMELHETVNVSREDYQKITGAGFIKVCPTCHKIEHEKIRNA